MYVKVVKNEQENGETFCEGVARKTVTATVPEEARTITTATRELQLSWFANKKSFLFLFRVCTVVMSFSGMPSIFL